LLLPVEPVLLECCSAEVFEYRCERDPHIQSCEFFPVQAVKTNVLGAENVIRAAIANNAKKLIVLSTDKAVYPINAMGMSKALMEKVMIAYSRQQPEDGTVLCGTRYGNVMASSGSVIPLFVEQIKAGKPIIITDPNMIIFVVNGINKSNR